MVRLGEASQEEIHLEEDGQEVALDVEEKRRDSHAELGLAEVLMIEVELPQVAVHHAS